MVEAVVVWPATLLSTLVYVYPVQNKKLLPLLSGKIKRPNRSLDRIVEWPSVEQVPIILVGR